VAGRSRLRVLVVEDEVLVGMLLEDMLLDLDYEVAVLSTNLVDALEKARSAEFDLAVLDVNLNGQQSFPVADVIRRRGGCRSCSPRATATASWSRRMPACRWFRSLSGART
jgi:CheY-like chemotaxis protein